MYFWKIFWELVKPHFLFLWKKKKKNFAVSVFTIVKCITFERSDSWSMFSSLRFKHSNFGPVVSVLFTSWFLVHYNARAPCFWTLSLCWKIETCFLEWNFVLYCFAFQSRGVKNIWNKIVHKIKRLSNALWLRNSSDMLPPAKLTQLRITYNIRENHSYRNRAIS